MDLNWLPPLDDGDHRRGHGGAVQPHGGLMFVVPSNWEATAKANTLRTDLHLTYEKSTQCITFDQDQWIEVNEVKANDSQQLEKPYKDISAKSSLQFRGDGRVPRHGLGRQVIVAVGAVEEGLPSLVVPGEVGVEDQTRAGGGLRVQGAAAGRRAILHIKTETQI